MSPGKWANRTGISCWLTYPPFPFYSIFRTNTVAEDYNLFHVDNFVDIRASNNISFTWDKNNTLYQRIDRAYQRSCRKPPIASPAQLPNLLCRLFLLCTAYCCAGEFLPHNEGWASGLRLL